MPKWLGVIIALIIIAGLAGVGQLIKHSRAKDLKEREALVIRNQELEAERQEYANTLEKLNQEVVQYRALLGDSVLTNINWIGNLVVWNVEKSNFAWYSDIKVGLAPNNVLVYYDTDNYTEAAPQTSTNEVIVSNSGTDDVLETGGETDSVVSADAGDDNSE